jgi:hypothetical protein
MKGAARRAMVLALSSMTGKGPKRYGIRIPRGRRALSAQPADCAAAGLINQKPMQGADGGDTGTPTIVD